MESSGRSPVAEGTVSSPSTDEMNIQARLGPGLAASFISSTTSTASPEDAESNRAVDILHAESTIQKEKKSLGREKYAWVFVRTFTPSWFAVNMGTGIVSILLHNLPYNGTWLYWISVIIFALNVLLFAIFLFISVLRYFTYPGLWTVMIRHPVVPLFLGAFPMGLATIIEMIVLVCVPVWGHWAITLAWVLWWIDSIMSIAICYLVPFMMMHLHDTKLPAANAAWLLPIASVIVASGVGGVVSEVLVNEEHALWTLVVSYILWGTSIPLSMSYLVIYLHRLFMHNLPPREVIVSAFIPVGTLGQGAFAIMQFGKVASMIFTKTKTLGGSDTRSGEILYVFGWIAGLIMWAYGLAWLFFALASISRGKMPFNLGWWSCTFPLGVWASAAISFGQEMPSTFFRVLGTVISVIVTMLWLMVSIYTIRNIAKGQTFVAPDFNLWQECKSRS
ncbi:voltage-dependent anion channel-domain-containing protein, partial [Dactylonectria estremocensis]